MKRLAGLAIAGLLAATAASAADGAGESDDAAAALRAYLEQKYPRFEADSIEKTPLDGIYQVVSGTDIMYISADGRYLLRGSLIDLEAQRNLTQNRKGALVRERIGQLDADDMLVFPPANGPAEYRITVFTDTTCPYCKRLHSDLLALRQKHPLEIRYLLFPRAGLDSEAADQMRRVWCSDDPQAALTAAKQGETVAGDADACDTPMARHHELARQLGIDGTPFLIVGDDGPVVSGYRPQSKLESMLGIGSNEGTRADG
jgi:thiol:disulfide interchange protein DsbC